MDDRTFQRGGLSLSSIEHFVASADENSMSAAALRLGVSIAHISKSIGRLEKRMQVRLLHRTTRHFSLTTEGRVLYERACTILDGVRHAEAMAMWESPARKCSFSIRTSDFLACRILWPCLRKLQARYPGIDIEIQTGDFDEAASSSGKAIRVWTGLSLRPGAIRLAQWPNYFMASERYIENNGRPSELYHLADHALVGGQEEAWIIEGPEGLRTLRHAPLFRSNSLDLIQEAIRSGTGIGLCSPFGLERELATGPVMRVLPSYATPMSHALWAEAPERGRHPAHDLVLDHIRDALKEINLVLFPETHQWAA